MADHITTYKEMDTCAASSKHNTPYFYSTYKEENEACPLPDKESVIILGRGPNGIGQGIEFTTAACTPSKRCRELGYQAIMVNCNPETVSTDTYLPTPLLEPLTFEDVLNIIERTRAQGHVVVQFGGQTPLKIAERLHKAGVLILATTRSEPSTWPKDRELWRGAEKAQAQGAALDVVRNGPRRRSRVSETPRAIRSWWRPSVCAWRHGRWRSLLREALRKLPSAPAVRGLANHPVLIRPVPRSTPPEIASDASATVTKHHRARVHAQSTSKSAGSATPATRPASSARVSGST